MSEHIMNAKVTSSFKRMALPPLIREFYSLLN